MKNTIQDTILIISLAVFFPASVQSDETYRFDRMWPTLREPWYFFIPVGIARDSSGNIYVVDSGHNLVYKFTPDGTLITKWGGSGAENGKFNWPAGVAIDLKGNVYVTDQLNHRIQKFSSEGTFIDSWEGASTQYNVFQPEGITIDTAGTVYVTDIANNIIQRFTSNGELIPLVPPAWGSEIAGVALLNPKGLAFDKEGYIYVADYGNNRILKFDLEGTPSIWASGGEFNLPYGIAVDGLGDVYVSDMLNHRIQKFTSSGVLITTWGSFGLGNGELNGPRGITIDENGNTYVADSNNSRIVKFSPDGTFMAKWTSQGFEEGYFDFPRGIATDASGNLYIVDGQNNRIQKFDAEGAFLGVLESWEEGNERLNLPRDIALDLYGTIYVADTGNDRVVAFAPDGSFVRKWGSSGDDNGEFDQPFGIAIDTDRNIYVADQQNHRIQKFSPEGAFITSWGSPGQEVGAFDLPSAVAVDTYNNVYVADSGNNRIQKFTSDGTFVKTWGSWGREAGQFDCPSGVSLDPTGYVYVTDLENDRVQKFTHDGIYVTAWGDSGTGPGNMRWPASIVINPVNGKVYLTEIANDRIQVFKPIVTTSNPKAIIVAGGGPYPGNTLWDATQACANFTYRALTHQGYTKDDIYYLTPDTDLDLDDNRVFDDVSGYSDDVDALPEITNLRQAITGWAVEQGADSLVLYLNDHGGEDTFTINEAETLTSTDLASWLDQLQTTITGRITVVYEACKSGSFADELEGDNRIIITSTLPAEQAQLSNKGTLSFSYFFWSNIFNGQSILDAFTGANQAVNFTFFNQTPQLAGDAGNLFIGNGVTGMLGDAPGIGEISPPMEIHIENASLLYAEDVLDPDGIARVWAVIWPPDYDPGPADTPLIDLPSLELLPVGEDRYQGTYPEFNAVGTYRIAIYAMDSTGNISLPKFTTLSKSLSRRALIVAGGEGPGITRKMIEHNATLAYNTLISQYFSSDDIYLMSLTTFLKDVVTYFPTIAKLEYYLEDLTADATVANLDLTIYLIGGSENGSFILNDTPYDYQNLSASRLAEWLDDLQAVKPGRVTLICDFDQSGSFIQEHTLPEGRERVTITSTGTESPAYFNTQGDISFSSFFLNQAAGGATVGDAFIYARKSISYCTRTSDVSFSCYRPQSPLIDANSNGLPNEPSDYELAKGFRMGNGILFADDPPRVGSVSLEETEGVVTITAEEITATSPIERVWAVLRPIRYCPGGSESWLHEIDEVELIDPEGDGSYEGTYPVPSYAYRVTVYALNYDSNGEASISRPFETKICQEEGGDIYEPDDTPSQAQVIVVNYPTPQPRTFHYQGDEDWVRFYGIAKDENYTIEAGNLGDNCPVIELYDAADLTEPIALVSDPPVNGKVWLDFRCERDGIYYVKLLWGDCAWVEGKTDYDLLLYDNNWGLTAIVAGKVKDRLSGRPIDGAIIKSNGIGATISTHGEYLLSEIPGRWTMRAWKDGYVTARASISITSVDQYLREDISMLPRSCKTDPECDDGDFCNGAETCLYGTCAPGTSPCPDDGLYCNGAESCDEEADSCTHSGSPCPGHLDCVEENDQCVEKPCTADADCDDREFCNGPETCLAGICQTGTNPCAEPTPVCDEEHDRCVEGPSITLLPNPYLQSRWMPMLFFLRIVGTNTHFDGSSWVTFEPPGGVMALQILGDEEHLLMVGILMPGWLMTTQSIEVTVSTREEVASEVLSLRYPFVQ